MTAYVLDDPGTEIDLDRWPALAAPADPGLRARVAQIVFRHAIGRLPVTVELPDGTRLGRGGPAMVLHRPDDFFARLAADGLIGFGEAYLAGDFDSAELGAFLTELCRELTHLLPQWMQRLRRFYVARPPSQEANTLNQARGNIARHYDLSNEMFATFLDESMTYSAALFADLARPEPLVAAQHRKTDRLLDLARVGADTRLLEIGTGWGDLAIRAAARGAQVHSVTLSAEQLSLARERVAAAGYADRVRLELCDYRDLTVPDGGYDAIVSVEMIEAVGHEYWATYFATLDSLLARDGRVALQAITMPHDRMLATRNTWTWINKYIFPGGFLPSTEAIDTAVREHTSLAIQQRLSMGSHYARTLREWDERFSAAHDDVTALGFDRVFERMWHFYLCYSEAGFASGYIDVQQLQLARGGR